MSKIILTTIIGLLSSIASGSYAINSYETGSLIKSSAKDTEVSYDCVMERSGRTIAVRLDEQSQMLEVITDDGEFRGVATRARYVKNGQSFTAHNLENEGEPYFYDFSLVENTTSGQIALTLQFGAFAFNCAN